jgi:phosphoribosyl 1,2-cyclic phosphate phosphodiesterase
VLITTPTGRILIDCGPEMRLQLLAAYVPSIDAVLLTHAHADHIHGLDDLRQFTFSSGNPVDVFASAQTLKRVTHVYDYCFKDTGPGGGKPQLHLYELNYGQTIGLAGITIKATRHMHGSLDVTSFVIGDRFVYCTDVSLIPEETMAEFEGKDVVVVGAVRPDSKPHASHFVLPEALDVLNRLAPRLGLITHMSHSFEHGTVEAQLPKNRRLAYDGLIVSLSEHGISLAGPSDSDA